MKDIILWFGLSFFCLWFLFGVILNLKGVFLIVVIIVAFIIVMAITLLTDSNNSTTKINHSDRNIVIKNIPKIVNTIKNLLSLLR
ncbi:hypothetical protein [Clostridium sp.]|uniref:hypothetical protein n=1 Tax=Clostridium sp. TaxID=1506 RepID=UPI003D6CBB66